MAAKTILTKLAFSETPNKSKVIYINILGKFNN